MLTKHNPVIPSGDCDSDNDVSWGWALSVLSWASSKLTLFVYFAFSVKKGFFVFSVVLVKAFLAV